MTNQETEPRFLPLATNTFRFRCHKGIPCFTKCCADLKLLLTPYDILRLKNRLRMPSEVFLENYTDTVFEDHLRFPMVRLRMEPGPVRKCPFVTPDGCAIYEDRPGSCRLYPLGRASQMVDREKTAREKYFIVEEPHCLGFQEDRLWSLEEWMGGEGMIEYNEANDRWLEVVTCAKGLGPSGDIQRKVQMFFMASYNLDRFRDFVFRSPFLKRFNVGEDLKEKLARDDMVLLFFSFEWLKLSLFGIPTNRIQPVLPPAQED